MMSNKSDEAEMTFFFLSLLSVKEGMNFCFFYSVIEKFWEIDFFLGLVAELVLWEESGVCEIVSLISSIFYWRKYGVWL